MPHEAISQTQQIPTSQVLSQGNILQRQCISCGQHKTGGGTCAKCQAKAGARALQPLPVIQTKLTVGQPDDKYEKEADRVAEQVMRMPASDTAAIGTQFQSPRIQRMCANCEEEEKLQAKEVSSGVPEVTPAIASRIQSLQQGGQPLSAAIRNFFEPRFGRNFSTTRIHTDASAQALQARAYTIGHNIVFGAGQYAPETTEGKRLLAHELTHTVQQTNPDRYKLPTTTLPSSVPKSTAEKISPTFTTKVSKPVVFQQSFPDVLARSPAPILPATAADQRQMVDAAVRWLNGMTTQVQTMRRAAALALASTPGRDAGPRAFRQYLNQERLGQLLDNTISVFEAQRSHDPQINFPSESPEQTRLGEAYARALEQFGLAMEEAYTNAANLSPTDQELENTRYARNHMRWLAANPAAPLAAGIRTTFTQAEVELSTRRHQQVSSQLANLVATVHQYNLAGDGAQRLSRALLNATYRLVREPVSASVTPQRDTGLETSIQPVLDQLNGIQWAVSQAVDRLEHAETRTRSFADDAAANPAVGLTLQTHFSTQDPGYAILLADRFARMARELCGEGSLTIYAHNPQDSECTVGSVGGGLSGTVAHADANSFHFCGNVSVGDDRSVSTIVHETVHAVIPNLGAQGAVTSSSDTPRDRAYVFERIYSRLSTEEALDNAETYSFYVDDLLGVQVRRPSAPQDTVTDCANSDTVHEAIARAAYRIRLGAQWAEQTTSRHRGATLPQDVITVVREGFPGADATRSQEVLTHLRNLANRLDYFLSVSCRSATDREARAGALVYGPTHAAMSDRITRTTHSYPSGTLRICPNWFQANAATREDTLTAILTLHYRATVPEADVMGLVTLIRFIQEEAHPSVAGRTLQQHQDADVRSPAPTSQHPTIQPTYDQFELEKTLQTKETANSAPEVTSAIASRIQSLQGGGQPLSTATRNFFEPRFGQDFSHVRIHTDDSARSLQARAYTIGNTIVFRAGEYSPSNASGKRLLAHELTHVVQQAADSPAAASPVAINAKPTEFMISRADPEAVRDVLRQGRVASSGIRFWPRNVIDTRVGLVSVQGGLLSTHASQLNVIIGKNLTLRTLARQLLPLWNTATPFTPPDATTPIPLDQLTEEQLTKGLLVYNQTYLPVPAMTNWRSGLRFPLPVEIDEATGIATLHPTQIHQLASAFDPAWERFLYLHAGATTAPSAATLQADVAEFLRQGTTPLSQGIHLSARALTNAVAERPFIQETFAQLGDRAFDAALAFMNNLVNREIQMLAAQQDGAAILGVISTALVATPTSLSADQQRLLDRANQMLGRGAGITAQAPSDIPSGASELIWRPSRNGAPCACLVFIHNNEPNAHQVATDLHQRCRYNLASIERGTLRGVPILGRAGGTVDPNELFPQDIQSECTRDESSCREYMLNHRDLRAMRMQFFLAIKDCSNRFSLPTVALHNNVVGDTAAFRRAIPRMGSHLENLRDVSKAIASGEDSLDALRDRLRNLVRGRSFSGLLGASGSTNIFRWCNLPEIIRCHIGDPTHPDHVIWTTHPDDYDTLSQADVNVVLQAASGSVSAESETDLSTLFTRLGSDARFINIETPQTPRTSAEVTSATQFVEENLRRVGLNCCDS